ncbi:MAG: ATP phosphoribosyltransferase regulatory subunit [Myxococcota bacterium]
MPINPVTPHPPLSRSVKIRRAIAQKTLAIFEGWSYREIDVPLLDYFDHLRDAIEPDAVHRMFRFVDREGNLRVLRADVTPAIAKIYAHRLTHLPQPLRLCYANRVVRIERSFTSEQTDAYQLGVEMLGASGLVPELEVMLVCMEVLDHMGIDDYQLTLSNLAIYRRLLEQSNVPTSLHPAITTAVRDRDPFEIRRLLHKTDVGSHTVTALECMAELRGGVDQLTRIQEAIPNDALLKQSCLHMKEIVQALTALNRVERLHVDMGHISGPTYYTGMMFRIISESIGRELGGGGRYDDLVGTFGTPTPAVGFSIHLDALMEIIAPHASEMIHLDSPSEATVAIDTQTPVAGLRRALERRAAQKVTRVDTASNP